MPASKTELKPGPELPLEQVRPSPELALAVAQLRQVVAVREPERQRWRCLQQLPDLDYCREQCWTMTWTLE
jgi:hypothetical protein